MVHSPSRSMANARRSRGVVGREPLQCLLVVVGVLVERRKGLDPSDGSGESFGGSSPERPSVRFLGVGTLARSFQRVDRVRADRFEHAEAAGSRVALERQERAVPQRQDRRHRIAADRLCYLEIEGATHDGEATECRLLVAGQQPDAPIERRLEGSMACRSIATLAAQKREPVIEPTDQLRQGHPVRPVQPPARRQEEDDRAARISRRSQDHRETVCSTDAKPRLGRRTVGPPRRAAPASTPPHLRWRAVPDWSQGRAGRRCRDDDLGDDGRYLIRQVLAVVHEDDGPVSAELTDERLDGALLTAGPDAERSGDASLHL